MDCDTGSPMADTQVRQVFLVAGGGEAAATEYVRSSRLFFTRRSIVSDQRQSGGSVRVQWIEGLSDGDGGIAAPLLTLDIIVGLPASALLGDGRAGWWERRC